MAVIGAIALAACAQPGYDPSRIQRELRQAGVSADKARCVTDRFESEFPDLNQLGSHSQPTADEHARADAILQACGVIPKPPR